MVNFSASWDFIIDLLLWNNECMKVLTEGSNAITVTLIQAADLFENISDTLK